MTNQHSNQQPLLGVGNCQPYACQAANPIGQGLVGKGPLLGGLAKLPTPDGAGVGNSNTPVPTLDDLVEIKHRLNAGVSYCLKRVGAPQFDRGQQRLMRILSRDYLPAISALRATYPSDALTAERDTITERLERGWALGPAPDGDEGTDRMAQRFTDLLARYEVLEDCLADGGVIERHMQRVERVAV